LPAGTNSYRGAAGGREHEFCCFGCYLAFRVGGEKGEEAEATLFLIRIGVGSFLSMNVMMLSLLLYSNSFGPAEGPLRRGVELIVAALATPAMIILGLPLVRDAWRAAQRRRLTAEALISVSSLAAFGYSLVALFEGSDRVYFDTATMLLLLFTVGRYLEAAARARAVRDISPLFEAEIATARVVSGDGEVSKPAFELVFGDLVRVGPGERIAVDGEVVEGSSSVDQALITGEADPIARAAGDRVFAGTVNGEGQLLLRTSAAATETHWAEIGRAVRAALERRSQLSSLGDRISTVFLPLVLLVAAAAGGYWLRHGTPWDAVSASLATLVVACPCALGPAAYLASFLGLGLAAKRGIVIRTGQALQDLARSRSIAFDKTGCLTRGRPALTAVVTDRSERELLLTRAAGLALASDHPLSRAVVAAAAGLDARPLPEVEVRRGLGLVGRANGVTSALGSLELFRTLDWRLPADLAERAADLSAQSQSIVLFGRSGAVEGILASADDVKVEAVESIRRLRDRGLSISILSGDHPAAVRRIAEALGVTAWRAGLSPHQKLDEIRSVIANGGEVVMVGDGLNDGPALAGSTVGIALGSGTRLARTSAEIVTADDDLLILPWLIDLARTVRRKTVTNLSFAFGYNVVGIGIAASGYLQPILAAALMAASSLVVVANSFALKPSAPESGVRMTALRPLRRHAAAEVR
jgi:heavy metal translocating P-type ATPase